MNIERRSLLSKVFVILLIVFLCTDKVIASIDKYSPGETVIIGEFVYDDDMVATTTDCTVSIYNPSGTLVGSNILMNTLANGWHYYSTTTISTEGVWPTTMTCGSIPRGDLANLDKTFIIGYSNASTTAIADSVWNNTGSTSIAATVNANTNAQLTSAISTINNNTNATVLTASTSLLATIPTGVWANTTRTLSSFGTLAADVWSAATRTLTTSSQASWSASFSNFGSITAGSNYLANVTTVYNDTLTDSLAVPTVTIYDPSRNVVVNAASMTRTSTGTYSYSYTTAGNAAAGTWESVFSVNVETGKTLPGNDYWTVVTAPAQVIVNSMSDTVAPQVAANVTITNEGLTGYEYQYEWCVVSSVDNSCGGGDDVFHGTAAKYINAGEDFNTTLTADIAGAGDYYFKVIAYFGTESSGASRTFTATAAPTSNTGGSGGGGGGGGGGGSTVTQSQTMAVVGSCKRSDYNCDTKVNSIDFSILLYFWKSKPPFTNKYVDVTKDGKIDSVDFSILLYDWSKK